MDLQPKPAAVQLYSFLFALNLQSLFWPVSNPNLNGFRLAPKDRYYPGLIELYRISLTFSRLKYELDQLFSELTVRCPELAGYKSDGPLRKLEMLSGQWRRLGGTSPASTPLNRTCPTFTSSPLDRISPNATKGWVTSQRYRTRQQRSSQKEMSNEERDKASKIKIFL